MPDPQSLCFDLRLCIDSIAAILPMVCVPQSLVTPRSYNLSNSLPYSSSVAPRAWYCNVYGGPQVREAPFSDHDKNAGTTALAPTAFAVK